MTTWNKLEDLDNDSELEFLRYIYSTLNTEYKIAIQKSYYKNVPEQYYIYVCQSCNQNIAIDYCNKFDCNKMVCDNCRNNVCINLPGCYCSEHLKKCPSCNTICACDNCRVYIVNQICNICCESYETSYSCTICSEKAKKEETCVYCKESINPFTLERL
jgi:hypothetical protein